jgi:hypothetical protein
VLNTRRQTIGAEDRAAAAPHNRWQEVNMDDKIIVAIISTGFGVSIPFLANIWDKTRRAHRIVAALDRELTEVTAEIERKLEWIGRDVSNYLKEVDCERVIEAKGIRLYLGEREEFEVPRAYWKSKYTDIAEAISDSDFSDFYVMYRLVDRFEKKFHEMKMTFETSLGQKDVMALACFDDLTEICKELKSKLTSRSRGRCLT